MKKMMMAKVEKEAKIGRKNTATSTVETNEEVTAANDEKRMKPNTPATSHRILAKRPVIKKNDDDKKSNQTISQRSSVWNGVKKPDTLSSSSNNLNVQSFCNALEQVLSIKHADVIERLKVTFPAQCIQSLKKCGQEHCRNEVSTCMIFIFPSNV